MAAGRNGLGVRVWPQVGNRWPFLCWLGKGASSSGVFESGKVAWAILIRQVDCGRLKAAEFVVVVFELIEKGDQFRRERRCNVRRRGH